MKLISHRGNVTGHSNAKENDPENIVLVHELYGFDVEVDLWYIPEMRQLFLGHDRPQYEVEYSFLFENRSWLWIHCKNPQALHFMHTVDHGIALNYFYHNKDSYTLTSKNWLWMHPDSQILSNGITVLPETGYSEKTIKRMLESRSVAGICSDYLLKYQ